jgi:group I intron endonuclease
MEYTIYKIYCNDESITDCYIGSTKRFKKRQIDHKCASKKETSKLYNFIREHNGWDNFNMIILETVICETKQDIIKKEQEYIELLKPTLNTSNAFGINIVKCKLRNKKNKQTGKYKEQQRQYAKQRYIKQKELKGISL